MVLAPCVALRIIMSHHRATCASAIESGVLEVLAAALHAHGTANAGITCEVCRSLGYTMVHRPVPTHPSLKHGILPDVVAAMRAHSGCGSVQAVCTSMPLLQVRVMMMAAVVSGAHAAVARRGAVGPAG